MKPCIYAMIIASSSLTLCNAMIPERNGETGMSSTEKLSTMKSVSGQKIGLQDWNDVVNNYRCEMGYTLLGFRDDNYSDLTVNAVHGIKIVGEADIVLGRLYELGFATQVRYLDLSASGITRKGIQLLSNYQNAESLNLSKCFVEAESFRVLPKSIKFLNLAESHHATGELGLLSELCNLQALSLAGIRLDRTDIESIRAVPSLEFVDLSITGYTGACCRELFSGTNITVITNRPPKDVYGGAIS